MRTKIFAILLITSSLYAENNTSIWDLTSKSINSLWEKSKEIGSESWKETKKYTNIGKNLLFEETLLTSMNLSLDTNTTEVKKFKINEDDSIKMEIKLVGEKEDLILDIKNYNWAITKDKKYIVFEDIKYNANIPWIKYLLDFYLDKNKGYITIPYSISKQSLLYSLKKPIKTNYNQDEKYAKLYWKKIKMQLRDNWQNSDKKDLSSVFSDILDKNSIDISSFKIDDENIHIDISLEDATTLNLNISNFDWATANKRTYILFRNIELDTNRAWIKGILKNQKNSFYFSHSKIIEKMLKTIKPPLRGKKR